jgi:hypothetical protein
MPTRNGSARDAEFESRLAPMSATFLVVGEGPLALGEIVPTLQAAGIQPLLILSGDSSRSEETRIAEQIIQRDKQYILRYSTTGTFPIPTVIKCESCQITDFEAKPGDDLCIALAVGPSLDQRTKEFIRAQVKLVVGAGNNALIFPCENRFDDDYVDFLLELEDGSERSESLGAIIIASVVDRICSQRDIHSGDYLSVYTEQYCLWVMQYPPWNPVRINKNWEAAEDVLESLFVGAPGVMLVGRTKPYRARKRLVLGSQMVLAMSMAADPEASEDYTNDFLVGSPAMQELLERFQGAVIASIRSECRQMRTKDLEDYALEVRYRLSTERDTSERILGRFMTSEIYDWFATYNARVDAHLRKHDPELAERLLANVEQLMIKYNRVHDLLQYSLGSPKIRKHSNEHPFDD